MNRDKLDLIVTKLIFIFALSFIFIFFFGCLAVGFPLSLEGIYQYRLLIYERFEKNIAIFLSIFFLLPLLLSLLFYFIFVFKSDDRYTDLYNSLSQEIKKLKAATHEEKINHNISLEKLKHENELLKKQIPIQSDLTTHFKNLSEELHEIKETIIDLQEVTINYQEENEFKKEKLINAIAIKSHQGKKSETGAKPLRLQPLKRNT